MNRILKWLSARKLDVVVVLILAIAAATVGGVNAENYPQRYEDEGTYVAQAHSVLKDGELAHYTYWYDHPPLGWIQVAGYSGATAAFNRHEDNSIAAGREFMVVMHVISVALLYLIARRLGLGVVFSIFAAGIYIFSPLSLLYSRYVFLENIAMPWLLGAFFLALSPRRHIGAAVGSALCMAIAVLSKETLFIFFPALLYALYQNRDTRNQKYIFTVFGSVFFMISSMYLLFAVLKGELFPSADRVSLTGAVAWQLFARESTGSVLEAGSVSNQLVQSWLKLDPWILISSLILLPVAFVKRHIRPIALALFIGFAMMLRPGYLPIPYTIGLLPFMSLTIAAALYTIFTKLWKKNVKADILRYSKRSVAVALSAMIVFVCAIYVVPSWSDKIDVALSRDADGYNRELIEWVDENVPKDATTVVESTIWSDLERKGFPDDNIIWIYKTETDPEVTDRIGDWRGFDYLILDEESMRESSGIEFPRVYEAQQNAEIIAQFGTPGEMMTVLEVNN